MSKVVKAQSKPEESAQRRKDEDDSCIYIDDEQLLNKSDIIKSFVANDESSVGRDVSMSAVTSTAAAIATAVGDEKAKKENEQANSDLDDESVSSFGSSIDDYNYYNSRLFDDDDDEDVDDGGQSSREEFADELDETADATTTADHSIYKQQK